MPEFAPNQVLELGTKMPGNIDIPLTLVKRNKDDDNAAKELASLVINNNFFPNTQNCGTNWIGISATYIGGARQFGAWYTSSMAA